MVSEIINSHALPGRMVTDTLVNELAESPLRTHLG